MTCRDAIEVMIDYLDGTLEPHTLEEFEHHLKLCLWCVRYLSTYRQTIRMAGAAFPAEVEVPEELVHAILTSRA